MRSIDVLAVTVALRGALSSSARSPKNAPGPRVATTFPCRVTSASPATMAENAAPVAPPPRRPAEYGEDLAPRRALPDHDVPGIDVDVLGQLRQLLQLLLRAGG